MSEDSREIALKTIGVSLALKLLFSSIFDIPARYPINLENMHQVNY